MTTWQTSSLPHMPRVLCVVDFPRQHYHVALNCDASIAMWHQRVTEFSPRSCTLVKMMTWHTSSLPHRLYMPYVGDFPHIFNYELVIFYISVVLWHWLVMSSLQCGINMLYRVFVHVCHAPLPKFWRRRCRHYHIRWVCHVLLNFHINIALWDWRMILIFLPSLSCFVTKNYNVRNDIIAT